MRSSLTNLSVLAYANNFTLWHYKTDDDSVLTQNYFNNAADMMNVGDIVIANIDLEGAPDTNLYVVSEAANGVVRIVAYS